MLFFEGLLVGIVIGFPGGWAFFKHRADIKAAAKNAAQSAVNKV